MKIRQGFVTNSSSTCYILDLSNPVVQSALESTMDVTIRVYRKRHQEVGRLLSDGFEIVDSEEYGGQTYFRLEKQAELAKASKIGVGRGTSYEVGRDALKYGDYLSTLDINLGPWIMGWFYELGKNLLFIRESDEGMSGYLSSEMNRAIEEYALDQMECH